MEDGEKNKIKRFFDRNSTQTQEHLNVSVDNNHSNFDALHESQNPKIDSSHSETKCKSVRTSLEHLCQEESRLYRDVVKNRHPRSEHHHEPRYPPKKVTRIAEPKNEILSRTFALFSVKTFLKVSMYLVAMWLLLNSGCSVAESAPVKRGDTSLTHPSSRGLANNRTFRNYNNNSNPHYHASENWLAKRPKKPKKPVNKNCKEYDITSRAFLADLVFEGTARSRSKRASGRYVTFVIQKVLKQKNNLLRPKTQIRLHFGGKGNRKQGRANPLNDCPINSITSGNRAIANLKFGENYYVFADYFGPMNYTAKGEPIVVNRRNLKSIRSVLSKNKGKPWFLIHLLMIIIYNNDFINFYQFLTFKPRKKRLYFSRALFH